MRRQPYLDRGGDRCWLPTDFRGIDYGVLASLSWADIPRPITVLYPGYDKEIS
jgi:hypothetical protein